MFDFERIDKFLQDCNSAGDDTALRRVFSTYAVEFDLAVPHDPFSDEYRLKQLAIYEQLAGKPYAPINEVTKFDVASASVSPFPYSNGSCELVGNHLIAWGHMIRALDLPKGATILEFGPGWGNTTLALAKMGFHVTAVDIETNFCELISQRARLERLDINVINADFSYINSLKSKFDAVLFFECFHHSSDHLALIAALNDVVKPGGKVCFGSEPITSDFPIPWGMRMDGESIWAIRKNGWFEVGFNESYFEEAMRRSGWAITWNLAKDVLWASVCIARRLSELGGNYKARDGKLQSAIGIKNQRGAWASAGQPGYLAYGPYTDLPRGRYSAEFLIDRTEPTFGRIELDISTDSGTNIVQKRTFDLETIETSRIACEFTLESQSQGLEVRIFCHQGARLAILELDISATESNN